MKFLFPLSDLCPHCQQPLVANNEDRIIFCPAKSELINSYLDWENYNFYVDIIDKKINRIVYRIEQYVIIWCDNYIRSTEKSTDIYQIDQEFWDGYTNMREIMKFDDWLFLGNLDQPEMIKEKIDTMLLLK